MNLPLAIEEARYAVTFADRPLEALHVRLAGIITTIEEFKARARYADMNYQLGCLITDLFELMDDDSWVSELRFHADPGSIQNRFDADVATRELAFITTLKADLEALQHAVGEAIMLYGCPETKNEIRSFAERLQAIRELAPFWKFEEPLRQRVEEWEQR